MPLEPADGAADADPTDQRSETLTERLDRNWGGLLQELRVLQTGIQLLSGFLLTIAFQPGFEKLATWQVVLYLAVVSLAILATAIVLTPVALHRVLFRKHAMAELVAWGDRMVRLGLILTGLVLIGAISLVYSEAAGAAGAIVVAVVALAVILALWVALPRRVLSQVEHRTDRPTV